MLLGFLIAIFFLPPLSTATPEYAGRTMQGCKTCHIESSERALTEKGLEFAGSGYVWPPEKGYRVIGPIKKYTRLMIGLLHIVAAFFWFGTILYVHLLLKPAYAAKGLPKSEVALGFVSMSVVGVTGVLLTVSRIRSIDVLFTSQWGILLSFKMLIYAIMVFSVFFILFFVGPKLKTGIKITAPPKNGVFDPLTLSGFDGKEGRPAYIAYNDKVYDVTGLPLWEDGLHMKHLAGTNLTDPLAKAPHGAEKLETLRVVGSYDATKEPEKTPPQKAFYFIAYMNLALVFLVLFVIAFWRWGI